MTARVLLHCDRSLPGRLVLEDGSEYRCLGKSDNAAAEAHGNPTRNPLQPFGDLPAGEYRATRSVAKNSTLADIRSYGNGPVWVLNPVAGEAVKAMHNGRYGILLHGGAVGSLMTTGGLRPTHGCLRVDNSTIEALALRAVDEPFTLTVEER
jgi:hypothetical protein